MKWVALALLLGCGSRVTLEDKLDKLAKISKDTCACTTKKCADAQEELYVAWKLKNSKQDSDNATREQKKKFSDLRAAMTACAQKLQKKRGPR